MTSHLDLPDLIVPAFDESATTSHLRLNIHPGQSRILDYLADLDSLPFVDAEDVARFAICYGTHALLIGVPNVYAVMEARFNIFQDERFQRQKGRLADSIQRYVTVGDVEIARRLVVVTAEEYERIPIDYWRSRWNSTLLPAVRMLQQKGVRLPPRITGALDRQEAL